MASDALTHLNAGTLTDFAIHQMRGSIITEHDGYLVITSLQNPGYRWGNFVHILGDGLARSIAEWEDVFAAELPGLTHRTFGFSAVIDNTP